MERPLIIGLAGGSGSGKTTILRKLSEAFGGEGLSVLEHDAYYRDMSDRPFEERARVNFDHPDALETELIVSHIDALAAGHAVDKPVYDFTRHARTDRTVRVEPTPLLVVEGILVLSDERLAERMDVRVFVDTDSDVRLIRRLRRDVTERGRSVESVLGQYEATVRPMYLRFVEPSKRRAHIIIPEGGQNEVAVDMLLAHLRSHRA